MPPKYSRELTQPIAFGPRLKEQFRTSPCESACPAGNSIQKMQALVEQGDFTGGLRYLRAKNPFPGITGRVCPHFCMDACNRGQMEGAVNTRSLERACADYAETGEIRFKKRPASGKRVAIIGGGPAGLTSAYFLALLGHDATVYEARAVLGGMPRYGVPGFRLPRYIVDREVGLALETGFRAYVNTRVGADITLDEIRQRYDAIIVATGLPKENSLSIPGAERAVKAVEFLHASALGLNAHDVGRRVVVMGGGGVGFDCAFTARRLGAEEVHIVCLEKEGALRAPKEDVILAAKEGIHVHAGCTMSGIRVDGGKVSGVDCFRVREARFDENGRLELEPEADGAFDIPCDMVVFAVGMNTDAEFVASLGLELGPRGWIKVDSSQRSSAEGVFAAGDVSSGPASIARAIGDGRRAAFAAHAFLTGEQARVYVVNAENMLEPRDDLAGSTDPYVVPLNEIYGVSQYERVEPKEDAVNECAKAFSELGLGLSREFSMLEAMRCMHCGHCKSCGTCVDDCPGYVLEMVEVETGERPDVIYGEECWHCANCRTSCPTGAIGFRFPLRMRV